MTGGTRTARLGRARRVMRAPAFGPAVAAILIYCFFAVVGAGGGFTSLGATASWLNKASELGIIAVPIGLLMIAGEFDLSIGSMVSAGSITAGMFVTHFDDPVWLAVVVGATVALAVGLTNGLLVTRTGVPSFIVTLGTNLIMAGLALTLAYAVTGTTTVSVSTSGFWNGIFNKHVHQFDISIVWWLLLVGAGAWVLARSRFGPWILATGGNADRARRAGVLTDRVKIALFVSAALAATFIGMLQAVEFGTADATSGQGYVFEAPTVVVIGGVLLTGGFGSVLGVAMGTVLYGVIDAGFFYTGWNTNLSQVVLGVLLVMAVLMNNQLRRWAVNASRGRKT